MKYRVFFFLLFLILLFSAVSCSSSEKIPPNGTVIVTDAVGRNVSVVPGSYRRVVCIGAGALRMYTYVGDVSLLCGVEDIDNITLSDRPNMFDAAPRPYVLAYGDIFAGLPSCGRGGPNAQSPEAELILSCSPDIILSEYGDAELENALEDRLGVPVITLKSGIDGVFAEDFRKSLELIGTVFKRESSVERLLSFLDGEIAEISKRTSDIPKESRPAVYIAGLGSWGNANHLTTAEEYSAFRIANIRNVLSGLGMKGIGTIEEEKFVSVGKDTDIMFIDSAAVKNIVPLFRHDPAMFDSFRAWKTGEVYLQMPYNAYYTNFEIALANTWFLAKTVYPERFSDISMTEKLDEITTAFLGIPLAEAIYSCPASCGGYQKIDTASFFASAE